MTMGAIGYMIFLGLFILNILFLILIILFIKIIIIAFAYLSTHLMNQ